MWQTACTRAQQVLHEVWHLPFQECYSRAENLSDSGPAHLDERAVVNTFKYARATKKSTVIPVAKHNHPKVINDFRPVALTSLVMKCFEKPLLTKTDLLDLLPFAYRTKWGVEDAAATLHSALLLKHL